MSRPNPATPTQPTSTSPSEVLGYGRQLIDGDDVAAVLRVLCAEHLTQGPEVEAFEQALARATGAPEVVVVSSGTAALHLAYLQLGIERGDRVWMTANTFLASATTAVHCGAEISLLDVEPQTANLDLDRLEERIAAEGVPKAVCAVHFAGLPCDMERLLALKEEHGFLLVEDAAHALGARYRVAEQWWNPGAHPEVDATCLSFHPVKSITSGEGGAVLVHDKRAAARLRRLRAHGVARDYTSDVPFAPMLELGFNYRMSDLHAALGKSQLAKLDRFLDRRRTIAARYLRDLDGHPGLELPHSGDAHREHAWHLFVLKVAANERVPLVEHLRSLGIHPQLHYAPLSWHPWFSQRLRVCVPQAEDHARRALSLPLHAGLTDADVARVVDALWSWGER